jgi:hypothetical protein
MYVLNAYLKITPFLCVNYLHRCIITVSKERVTQTRNYALWLSSVSFNLKLFLVLNNNIAYQQNSVTEQKWFWFYIQIVMVYVRSEI